MSRKGIWEGLLDSKYMGVREGRRYYLRADGKKIQIDEIGKAYEGDVVRITVEVLKKGGGDTKEAVQREEM